MAKARTPLQATRSTNPIAVVVFVLAIVRANQITRAAANAVGVANGSLPQ